MLLLCTLHCQFRWMDALSIQARVNTHQHATLLDFMLMYITVYHKNKLTSCYLTARTQNPAKTNVY